MTQSPRSLSDNQLQIAARVMHEAVRAFQAASGQSPAPPWSRAPQWMKTASADAIRFRLDNPDAPPSAQHEQWMNDKIREGWRYGETKDGARKTHPLLVPYNDLPEVERRKDALVAGVIEGLSRPL